MQQTDLDNLTYMLLNPTTKVIDREIPFATGDKFVLSLEQGRLVFKDLGLSDALYAVSQGDPYPLPPSLQMPGSHIIPSKIDITEHTNEGSVCLHDFGKARPDTFNAGQSEMGAVLTILPDVMVLIAMHYTNQTIQAFLIHHCSDCKHFCIATSTQETIDDRLRFQTITGATGGILPANRVELLVTFGTMLLRHEEAWVVSFDTTDMSTISIGPSTNWTEGAINTV